VYGPPPLVKSAALYAQKQATAKGRLEPIRRLCVLNRDPSFRRSLIDRNSRVSSANPSEQFNQKSLTRHPHAQTPHA